MPNLRLEGIELNYNTRNRDLSYSTASFSLKPTDLTIEEGEFFALLGPSGCGKTTLLKLVAGLITPDKGDIYLGSQRITPITSEKRGFGMVFQQPLLFPHMMVEENVAFGLKMQGVSKAERLEEARNMLASVGLTGYGERYPSELSGGQQQRVSIARAIVSKPRLLLMDEPFSALDPGLREEMRDLVREIHREHGVTILFVTHDREEAFLLADRIGVMKEGVVLQVERPQELYKYPNSPDVAIFLGAKNVIRGELCDGWFASAGFRFKMPQLKEEQRKSGWLIIRPEILQVVDKSMTQIEGDDGLNSNILDFQAIVKQVSFRQGFYYLTVEVGSQNLDILQLAGNGFDTMLLGDRVTIKYDTREVRFISDQKETEGRKSYA